ncbi:uncharacterized protein A4U43_C02F15420 [Asparagus officinalis]|uniref:Uncharacterized protein n=1 Tax=Asparagus officinalis TaxID=4686 RepID=A0A5P1FJC0_ASPOF|nr:uncharacterized protein A4U43_C02F15420 [Asparagus officinalis]
MAEFACLKDLAKISTLSKSFNFSCSFIFVVAYFGEAILKVSAFGHASGVGFPTPARFQIHERQEVEASASEEIMMKKARYEEAATTAEVGEGRVTSISELTPTIQSTSEMDFTNHPSFFSSALHGSCFASLCCYAENTFVDVRSHGVDNAYCSTSFD